MTNLKDFPDSRKFEGEDDTGFNYDGYIVAISTWYLNLKKEIKQKLSEINMLDVNPVSYYQGQRDVLKEIIGE